MDVENRKGLPQSCLRQLEFLPCACEEAMNVEGRCYKPPESLGEGRYWYYEREGMFAISSIDLRLREDLVLEYRQPDFISVNYYDTISAEELNPYKRINAGCIRGHVSDGAVFRARYHRQVPIRGMELMLMPGYYHDHLERKYPGEFSDPKKAFRSVDGITDFPELVLILRQIKAFQGSWCAAHLFYESKVAEAVSRIIDRTRQQGDPAPGAELSKEDLRDLDSVRSFIGDHFASEIRIGELSRIACMGQTKLRCSFKALYGYTITEYIQNKRIAHAEYLLLNTDFPISQVGRSVGCNHAVRFSGLFRKITGFLPEEYRRVLKG